MRRTWAVVCLAVTGCEAADPGLPADVGGDEARAMPMSCQTAIDVDADGTVDERAVLRQDADGEPLDETWTDASGATVAVQTWTYDADGRVVGYARDEGADGSDDVVADIAYTADGRTETKTTYGYMPPDGLGEYDRIETWDWDRSDQLVVYRRAQRSGTRLVSSQLDYTLDRTGRLVDYALENLGEKEGVGFVLGRGGRPLEYRWGLLTGDEVWSYGWSGRRLVRSEVTGVDEVTGGERTPTTTTWTYDHGRLRRADVDDGNDGDVDATIDYTVDGRDRVLLTAGTTPSYHLTWGDDDRLAERVLDYGDSRETERFQWDDEGRILRYEHVRRFGPDNVETWTYGPGHASAGQPADVTSYERDRDGVVMVRYTYDDDGNVLSQYNAGGFWALPVNATYTYSGACTCQRGIGEQLKPIGPAPSRPCGGAEEVAVNWRLPDRPEPEYAGGGLSYFHEQGTSLYPDP